MKSSILMVLALVLAGTSFGACDPNQVLGIGSTWAFTVRSLDYGPVGAAAIGTFTIQPNGRLSAVQTVADGYAAATRNAQVSGRYVVYADCTGGQIMFMLNNFQTQFEFVYANSYNDMMLVSTYFVPTASAASGLRGTARRSASGCPAGVTNPLNLISGIQWSFDTQTPYFSAVGASVGILNPTLNAYGQGVLTGTETVNLSWGGMSQLNPISGRFLVNADCSGGSLLLMNRGPFAPPLQMEFVFAGVNFDTIYLLSDLTAPNAFQIVSGTMRKF